VSVTFAVATGGGSATGLTATTNVSGIATVGSWTLGTTVGSNTLTPQWISDRFPANFTATGTAGTATKLVYTTVPGSDGGYSVQRDSESQDANGNLPTFLLPP